MKDAGEINTLNNNMRCFEIRICDVNISGQKKLNNNMRCFEMEATGQLDPDRDTVKQ